MIAYVDTSVLLRVVLGQPDRLAEWRRIETAVTSALTEVEALRTLDRQARQGKLPEHALPARRGLAIELLERIERVDLGPAILRRAADPFPTPLGTLDALHLSTALLWSQARDTPLVLATHDAQLAGAAQAMGMKTIGV